MKNILERLNQQTKHDAWSEFVTGTLGSIGIDQQIRDIAQPVISKGESLLPKGGAIPESQAAAGTFSLPQITNYAESAFGKILQPKIMGIPVVIVGLVLVAGYLAVRKK